MIFGRELKTKTSDIKSGITTDSNSAALSMRLVYTYSSRPISLLLETSSFGNRGINFLFYVKAHGVKFVTKVCCPLIPTLIFHARNTTYLLRKGTFSTKFNPCYYLLYVEARSSIFLSELEEEETLASNLCHQKVT